MIVKKFSSGNIGVILVKSNGKRIFVKIIATVIILAFCALILDFINSFYGNPISKALAKNAAEKYINQNYKDLNMELQSAGYNFKFDYYCVHYQSANSIDTTFAVYVNSFGKVLSDDYEYEVANHFTTYRRFESELRKLGDRLFREELDYEISNALFMMKDKSEEDMLKLTLDMPFSLESIPSEIDASITITDKDVSYEKMSEVLIRMAEVCHKENIPVSTYSVRIEYFDENEKTPEKTFLSIYDIPKEVLHAEDIPKALAELDSE